MTETPKEYHFTDEQINNILQLVWSKSYQLSYHSNSTDDPNVDFFDELVKSIEDQIVNRSTNP
jgi:hypothetical protein